MGTPALSWGRKSFSAQARSTGAPTSTPLGCVAYYLLTGQLVFEADTDVATAVAHVQEAPVPPSLRSEFRISSALDALVLQCLAKDPAARPASAAAVSACASRGRCRQGRRQRCGEGKPRRCVPAAGS